jgi:serine/threonine-protein kinase
MPYEALGRYRLLSELGRGAMGHVFLAHDPEIDRNVALKTIQILDGLAESDRVETRERLMREARAAGKLLHPGIVTLFDVGETDGTLYLAMEHVEGQTLDAFTRPDNLLPVATVVEIIAGVAEALEYAHHLGVVHRDIKPANLMRVDETTAKIMDFGLARVAESQITQDGTLMGTPRYMSPEQIKGAELDGRSDLFSLAVVLYEMLAGGTPFPGDSVPSIIFRIVNEPPRDPAALGDRVPAPLKQFLERALSKNRDERFPQGGAFAAALRAAASGADAPAATDPLIELDREIPAADLPPRRSSQQRRTSSSRNAILLLLFLIAAVAALWVFRDRLPLDKLPLGFLEGEPEVVWLETRVRTEPPGLPVRVNGEPLDAVSAGVVRFPAEGDVVLVSTATGCRKVEQALGASDAGGEVVLLVESESWEGRFDPGVPGARIRVNHASARAAPVDLVLDLCVANEVVVSADGYRDTTLNLPEQARPVDVRTVLAGLTLDPVPTGTLRLGDTSVPLVYYVDGERLGKDVRELDLFEGTHELRFRNDTYWIDSTLSIDIVAGEALTPDVTPPALTTLVVQAFPANCKVFLRRPGGRWQYVDDTPARKRIAAGTYEVRVTFNPTGENKDQRVELSPGDNAPIRVSFSGG